MRQLRSDHFRDQFAPLLRSRRNVSLPRFFCLLGDLQLAAQVTRFFPAKGILGRSQDAGLLGVAGDHAAPSIDLRYGVGATSKLQAAH